MKMLYRIYQCLFHRISCIVSVLLVFAWTLFSAASAAPAVPVLCYHSVEPQGDIYNVTPQRLREHFEYFKKQGYTVISPAQFKAASQGKALPSKLLMLTFDDGYPSFYTAVYPLLKEYRYPAAMFIISSWPDSRAAAHRAWRAWDRHRLRCGRVAQPGSGVHAASAGCARPRL